MSSKLLRGMSVAAILALSACGGGSGVPSAPPAPPTPTPVPAPGVASFVLAPDSSSTIAALRRRPRYLSPSTRSLAIVVNGAGSATVLNLGDPAHCDPTGKCTIAVPAPAGDDTFLISAYAASNATGALLSRATVPATVQPNGTTTVHAVLDGAVAFMSVPGAPFAPFVVHHPVTLTFTPSAFDAAHNAIVGPGGYLEPILLKNLDTSGHTTLSKTSLSGPGDSVSLAYDGGYAQPSASASLASGAALGSITFGLTLDVRETTVGGSSSLVVQLVSGFDGAVWFADSGSRALGRMTTGGAVRTYPLPSGSTPFTLASKADGSIWYAAQNFNLPYPGNTVVGRRAADGTFTEWRTPGTVDGWLARTPDGALWIAEIGTSDRHLLRIADDGSMTAFTIRDSSGPVSVGRPVTGADGALYLNTADGIARLVPGSSTIPFGRRVWPLGATNVPVGPGPLSVGPDGTIWFVGTYYPLADPLKPASGLYGLDPSSLDLRSVYEPPGGLGPDYWPNAGVVAVTPDRAVWVAPSSVTSFQPPPLTRVENGNGIVLGIPPQPGQPSFAAINALITGPDGGLWYAHGNAIGRITP